MILFATQNFLPDIGGTQLYVTGLADSLAARGHDIAVYCDASSAEAARKVDAARAYPIDRFAGPRPLMRRRKAGAVARRIAEGRVTAVITDTWKSLEHLSAETLSGVRVLCLAHGSEFLVPSGSLKQKRMIACLAKADIVAANSQFTADLAKPFASGETKVEVVRPGVAAPAGASRDYRPRARSGELRIVTIARLEPRKGIDTVLRALPALDGVTYDIVGKGADKARLEALAAQLGVTDRVHFHGFISESEKAALLAAADVFALPNRREPESVEGFGLVFLEAAAFGVPSIAGADGGTADAVAEGQTGLFVDGDAAMAAALAKLLSEPELRAAMGRRAQERFWSEFEWGAAIARFETALSAKVA